MSERKVFASMTVSLDGRITGPKGLYDMAWVGPHVTTEQSRDALIRLTQRSSTVLLGRGNYEGFHGYWPAVVDMEDADPREREFAEYLNDVEKIVFSRTLTETTWKNSRLASASPVDTVRELRGQDGGDIWVMASKDLLAQLLEHGEVDRLEIHYVPQILGSGIRYFEDFVAPSSWNLSDVITTDSGALWLTFDIAK